MRQPIINFDCLAIFNSKHLFFQVDEIVKCKLNLDYFEKCRQILFSAPKILNFWWNSDLLWIKLEAQIDFQLTLTNNQLIFLNICILSCETSSKLLFGNLYCSNNYFCNFCISTAFYWGINLTILDISPNINHSNRVTMENPLKVG